MVTSSIGDFYVEIWNWKPLTTIVYSESDGVGVIYKGPSLERILRTARRVRRKIVANAPVRKVGERLGVANRYGKDVEVTVKEENGEYQTV